MLFDGTNLAEWVNTKDKQPAGWTVADGVLIADARSGHALVPELVVSLDADVPLIARARRRQRAVLSTVARREGPALACAAWPSVWRSA